MVGIQTLQQHSINLFLFIFFISNNGPLTEAQVYIYGGCSQDKYEPNMPYERNLNTLLSSIVSSSPLTLYGSFTIGNESSSSDNVIYGLYQCRGDLKTWDCSTCIATLIAQIELVCPYTYGAMVQLDRCSVRYENTDFLGEPDTSLRYRKCSNSVTKDAEFLRRRDVVLADLQRATSFRVSATGLVEGYAQCLGDLSRTDCSACLMDAVSQVKSFCGSAASGDMFLGQCYVRYWVAGHYDAPSDSSNDDQVGRSVAIIVGAIAGVAVLIVLLSFCKGSISKK